MLKKDYEKYPNFDYIEFYFWFFRCKYKNHYLKKSTIESIVDPIDFFKKPKWTKVNAYSKPNLKLGLILSDIRSHISDAGYYDDPDLITSAHETTHGINSNVRNNLYNGKPINALYCLDGNAVVLNEPNTRIEIIAKHVPYSLRGSVYKLYLVDQAVSGWGDRPLYILDEWICYTNGSATRKDLGIVGRAETVKYMMEFNIYSLTLLMTVELEERGYDSEELTNFIRWNIERSMSIYNNEIEASSYLSTFRTASDVETLRVFTINKFGKQWCKKNLDI